MTRKQSKSTPSKISKQAKTKAALQVTGSTEVIPKPENIIITMTQLDETRIFYNGDKKVLELPINTFDTTSTDIYCKLHEIMPTMRRSNNYAALWHLLNVVKRNSLKVKDLLPRFVEEYCKMTPLGCGAEKRLLQRCLLRFQEVPQFVHGDGT